MVQDLVHSFSGLIAMRRLSGMFEAGLYPGVNYHLLQMPLWRCQSSEEQLITCYYQRPLHSWYKRSELGIRSAMYFSAATISGAFSGLLAVNLPSSLRR